MSVHIANEIPRLLTGEARRDDVLSAAAHLRTCVDCQHELISAVVAHASLTSAQRFAPEIVSGLPTDLFPGTQDADSQDEPVDADESEPGRSEPELPDLSAVFAQVRREAAEPRRRERNRPRARHLAAAAAAVVVIGGGTAIYLETSGGNSHPTSTRTIKLAAFDKGTAPATATISGSDEVRIDAASLPRVSGKHYEVWLTDSGRTTMQPVGWLGADGKAAMTVPHDLLEHFSDIEVSVQQVDAKSYDYSGTSVLRGGYA